MTEEFTEEMAGQLIKVSRAMLNDLDEASRDFCRFHKLMDPRYTTLATLVVTESFVLRMLLRHFKPHERTAVAERIANNLYEAVTSEAGLHPVKPRYDA
jgi:hypothetical protein